MIVKRKDSSGDIRYGVRGPKHRWGGTFDTLREARQAERDAFSTKKPAGMSCGEFSRLWLAQDCPRTNGRSLKSDTLREYSYRLKAFQAKFDKEPLNGIPRDRAFQWALEHKHDVPFVAALFAHAHDLGLLESNPFAALGLSKGKGRKHNVPLTEKQLHELADSVYGVKVKRDEWAPYADQFRAFILFQGYVGMRPGETFELRRPDIEGDRIRVRRRLGKYGTVDLPKSNVERTILLPPPAREALDTFPRGMDLVFRGIRGQQLTRSSCFRYFDKVREAYGRPDLELYSLRHFCAHHLYVTKGLPDRVVAVQLGHNDGGALVRGLYGHGDSDGLEQLQRAWAVGE